MNENNVYITPSVEVHIPLPYNNTEISGIPLPDQDV